MATKLESLADEVQSLSTKNGIQKGEIGELQETVVGQKTTIVRHEATIVQHEATIVQHEAIIVRHEATIVRHEATIGRHEATIVRHEATIVQHEATIVQHEATIVRHEATIGQHEATIGQLNSKVAGLTTDNESLNSKVAGLTTDKNMQSALLMMHDLIALYRFYVLPDTPRWGDIIKQAIDAQDKLEDDEMSADDFEKSRVDLNNSLGLDDVDVFDLIRVSKTRNGMAHEEIGSAANQKAFLEKCASVTDFPEMFDDLRTKLLQRLSKVTLKRKK